MKTLSVSNSQRDDEINKIESLKKPLTGNTFETKLSEPSVYRYERDFGLETETETRVVSVSISSFET